MLFFPFYFLSSFSWFQSLVYGHAGVQAFKVISFFLNQGFGWPEAIILTQGAMQWEQVQNRVSLYDVHSPPFFFRELSVMEEVCEV